MFIYKYLNRLRSNSLNRSDSIVDNLLGDIYYRFNVSLKDSFDSSNINDMSSSRFSGVEMKLWSVDSDNEMHTKNYIKAFNYTKTNLSKLGKTYLYS